MVNGIDNSRVYATPIGTFIMHITVMVLLERCLLEDGAEHILILYLAHAEDAQGTVLRHGQNGFVHIVALAVEAALGPVLHAVLGEGVVGLGTVDERIEEVLHIPEGDADGLILGLGLHDEAKTQKTEQNPRLFHLNKVLFGGKDRVFRKKFVTLQRNKTRKKMTALQMANMNAEILRNLGTLAEDENMLNRVAKYLRKLVKEKEDPTLMSKEEFFAKLDEAEREIAEGKCITFDNMDEMNAWLNSL
jgi:hypothetical protein